MVDDVRTILDVVRIDPDLRDVGGGVDGRWNEEVEVGVRFHYVVDGTDDERDIRAVVSEVDVQVLGTVHL